MNRSAVNAFRGLALFSGQRSSKSSTPRCCLAESITAVSTAGIVCVAGFRERSRKRSPKHEVLKTDHHGNAIERCGEDHRQVNHRIFLDPGPIRLFLQLWQSPGAPRDRPNLPLYIRFLPTPAVFSSPTITQLCGTLQGRKSLVGGRLGSPGFAVRGAGGGALLSLRYGPLLLLVFSYDRLWKRKTAFSR